MTDRPTNPCNDCKVEYSHCPLYPKACKRFQEYVRQLVYPKACKRFDEYTKAVYAADNREIVIDNGWWYLMEIGTWRIMGSGPLPVPDKYKALEAK